MQEPTNKRGRNHRLEPTNDWLQLRVALAFRAWFFLRPGSHTIHEQNGASPDGCGLQSSLVFLLIDHFGLRPFHILQGSLSLTLCISSSFSVELLQTLAWIYSFVPRTPFHPTVFYTTFA
jgi:hypothetical protein